MIETVSSAPALAIGVAIARLPAKPQARRVGGASVSCNSTRQTVCTVHVIHEASQYLDASTTGNSDSATWSPPIDLPSGAELVIRWSGSSVGAIGVATVQWQYA